MIKQVGNEYRLECPKEEAQFALVGQVWFKPEPMAPHNWEWLNLGDKVDGDTLAKMGAIFFKSLPMPGEGEWDVFFGGHSGDRPRPKTYWLWCGDEWLKREAEHPGLKVWGDCWYAIPASLTTDDVTVPEGAAWGFVVSSCFSGESGGFDRSYRVDCMERIGGDIPGGAAVLLLPYSGESVVVLKEDEVEAELCAENVIVFEEVCPFRKGDKVLVRKA